MPSSHCRVPTHRRGRIVVQWQGLIFAIARSVGIEVPTEREKVPIKCPFHDDKHPSAVLFASNYFYCFACDVRLSAKYFAKRLGVLFPHGGTPLLRVESECRRGGSPTLQRVSTPAFTTEDAQRTWSLSLDRVQRDSPHPDDGPVFAYLTKRGLGTVVDSGCVGVLPTRIEQPAAVRRWIASGHRIVAPLFDLHGELVSIQSRTILDRRPKTLFPKGSRAAGTVFANRPGIDLLRGQPVADPRVLLGEGLTDSLAFAIACPYPALCAPGISVVESSVGSWVKGRVLVIAIDCDDKGESKVRAVAQAAYRQGAAFVHRVRWPTRCKDACDAYSAMGPQAFADQLLKIPRGAAP